MNLQNATTAVAFQNILYATDFSESAEHALPFALGLARRYGSHVVVVHVLLPEAFLLVPPESAVPMYQEIEESAKEQAKKTGERFAGIKHDEIVTRGDLWEAISGTINRERIDLLVLGTHGRGGVGKFLLGSVAEEIFRKTPCPVLTVGPHAQPWPVNGDSRPDETGSEWHSVLYATDFTPESLGAAPYAISLAQKHRANLTLLYVVEGEKKHASLEQESAAERAEYLRKLRKLAPEDAEFQSRLTCLVEHGDAAARILETAGSRNAGLIVLGVRGSKGEFSASHLPFATAHKVVARANCPVLTVRG